MAITRWTGEALDLDLAVACLMERDRQNGGVSAETSGRE
jgi:hypothetical protein